MTSPMSEAKHTPGPWQVSICDDGFVMVHTEGDVICHPDKNHEPGDEFDASNFRLIAAAPELLKQLTFMVEFFDGYQGMELQWAKDAIAKAEGRS